MRALRSALSAALPLIVFFLLAPSLGAQENAAITEADMEFRDSDQQQNVVQQALLKQGSGQRQLKVIADLKEKIAAETDAKRRGKLEKKLAKARKAAVSDFREALGFNSKLVESWAGLGAAYAEQGKYPEALQAYSEGSKVDASDETCFLGWARTLLDGQMFGNVVAAHRQLAEGDPAKATKLLDTARSWIAERRDDPQGIRTEDLDRLEEWIGQSSE